MKFVKAFTYVFDDPEWLNKVLIPVLVGLIPLVGQMVVSGWILDLIRNVANNDEHPLPALDFGRHLGRGFKVRLVSVVYAIPVIVLYLLIFLPWALTGDSDGASLVGIFFTLIGSLLMVVFCLALAFFFPAAQANLAVHDTFASAFDFKTIFGMVKMNYMAWLIVVGGAVVSSLIAPLGAIVIGIGAIITAFYAQTINAHLVGQAYAVSTTKVEIV